MITYTDPFMTSSNDSSPQTSNSEREVLDGDLLQDLLSTEGSFYFTPTSPLAESLVEEYEYTTLDPKARGFEIEFGRNVNDGGEGGENVNLLDGGEGGEDENLLDGFFVPVLPVSVSTEVGEEIEKGYTSLHGGVYSGGGCKRIKAKNDRELEVIAEISSLLQILIEIDLQIVDELKKLLTIEELDCTLSRN